MSKFCPICHKPLIIKDWIKSEDNKEIQRGICLDDGCFWIRDNKFMKPIEFNKIAKEYD